MPLTYRVDTDAHKIWSDNKLTTEDAVRIIDYYLDEQKDAIPEDLKKHPIYKGKGCSRCQGTGYKGRIAIHEILKLNDAIRDAILQRQTSHQIRGTARKKGNLISMREDGFYKAVQGLTSLEEIVRIWNVGNPRITIQFKITRAEGCFKGGPISLILELKFDPYCCQICGY